MDGTSFGKSLLGLSGVARENAILTAFLRHGLVSYAGGSVFSKIRVEKDIAGKKRVLEYEVSPLPAAIGTDADPFLFPAWPWTYQAIADHAGLVMITRKMALDIAKVATVRIEPHPYPATDGGKINESSERFIESNTQILQDLKAMKYKPGQLVSGAKKTVVVAPALNGSRVAIFGWFHATGPQTDTDKGRWQPYSTIHESEYSDYSHGEPYAKEMGTLDGVPIKLTEVAQDKLLWPLLSDQGPLSLHFPNAPSDVEPPKGYLPGIFSAKPPSKLAQGAVKAGGITGGLVAGAILGGVVAGPPGAVVGALLGAAIGRS